MIYIITHRAFDDSIVDSEHYKVLHVGSNQKGKETYLRDNVGDNIADKNPSYCELTGIYWIWKNAYESLDSTVGVMHYRRYFTTRKQDIMYTYFDKMPSLLKYEKLEKALDSYDIVLPKRITIFRTVKEFYEDQHIAEDLSITRKVILEIVPEYLTSFDKVMYCHYFYYGNMMVCKRKIFNDYCQWLFTIMFMLERRIDLNKYHDKYQRRVFGFIAERLLQVWVYHNDLKVKEYPVFNTEERRMNIFEINRNRIKKLKFIRYLTK